MRIVHIITGLGDGGAEGVLYRLCLNSSDSHHVVSMMGNGKYGLLLREAGVEVTCLGMRRGRLSAAGVRRLHQILKSETGAVVQTWMYHADLIGGVTARLARNPRVVWNVRHTNLDPQVTPRSTRVVAAIAAKLSRLVPTIIVACATAARASHERIGYDASKFVVIPNGYDLTAFRPDTRSARDTERISRHHIESAPIVGMVGRFSPQKDHGNLLRALALLEKRDIEFQAVLVGTDVTNDNEVLVRWISALGLERRVELLGPRTDVPALLNSFDLHVLPSNDEGFPNVVAEAMACGTPCVTTDVGDAALIVGDTGWVVPPRSAESLADAIYEALRERQQRPARWEERRSAAVSRIAERFSLESMIQGYRAVWARTVGAEPED